MLLLAIIKGCVYLAGHRIKVEQGGPHGESSRGSESGLSRRSAINAWPTQHALIFGNCSLFKTCLTRPFPRPNPKTS